MAFMVGLSIEGDAQMMPDFIEGRIEAGEMVE
jgi:hypothetical protein